MRKARKALVPALFAAALVISLSLTSHAQNREKFVISARAGGVNAVTGGASIRPHGNSEWQQLTIKEDLEKGDLVRTGLDGRVEMLLNPGSYMRVGENSEFELADNSLENLEVRLIRGTAIVEVTGADDQELFIGITTPHTRLSIVRRGLYRLNVVPGDTTELIVRKGRVMLEDSHTKVKGGNKVVFSAGSFSVAKLQKADKKNWDTLEGWSRDRAQALAKANSKLTGREMSGYLATFSDRFSLFTFGSRSGLWMYNPNIRCFTFLPFGYGWDSPYGASYSSFFYGGPYRQAGYGSVYGNGSGSGSTGSSVGGYGSTGGSGSSGGSYNPPTGSTVQSHGKPEINNGSVRERRPEN
ncbi:MAG TPA: FecR family protein [Pyrinomonadaceae bacterium]